MNPGRCLFVSAAVMLLTVPTGLAAWAAPTPTEQVRGAIQRVLRIIDDPELRGGVRQAERRVAIRLPYIFICLLAAGSVESAPLPLFYGGSCLLAAWAWPPATTRRSRSTGSSGSTWPATSATTCRGVPPS